MARGITNTRKQSPRGIVGRTKEEARDNGALVVCFVPARVDTEWWHRYAAKATEVRYPKGRVKNPDGGAWPFPIAVVIYRPRL